MRMVSGINSINRKLDRFLFKQEMSKPFPDPYKVCPNAKNCSHVDGYLCSPLHCEDFLSTDGTRGCSKYIGYYKGRAHFFLLCLCTFIVFFMLSITFVGINMGIYTDRIRTTLACICGGLLAGLFILDAEVFKLTNGISFRTWWSGWAGWVNDKRWYRK